MTEKEKAAICLMCSEPECTGEAKCFAKKRKEYQKKYYEEYRKGKQALNYICNVACSEANRKARITAISKQRGGKS